MMVRWAQLSDAEEIRSLWKLRFGDSDIFLDWFFKERFSPATSMVSEENGRIVCSIQSFPMHIRIRDSILPCAQIAGVSTLPEYEGKGHMGRVMRRFMNGIAQRAAPVVIYRPMDFKVYESRGHYPVTRSLYFTVNEPKVSTYRGDVVKCNARDAESEIFTLYSRICGRYSAIMERDLSAMRLHLADYTCDGGALYVLYVENGVAAYALAEPAKDCIDVRELVSEDGGAEDAMLRALCAEAAEMGLTLQGRLPCDSKPELYGIKTELRPMAAMGAADVRQLMHSALGAEEYTVEIRDGTVGANQGVFDMNGEPSDRPAQLVMDAGRLCQFVCGYESLDGLSKNGHAVIRDKTAAREIDRRFPRKKCFIWDEY